MNAMSKLSGTVFPTQGLPVVALHCSGASARQWRGLEGLLAGRNRIVLPQFSGPEAACCPPGVQASRSDFSLRQEAAPVLASMTEAGTPAHLVGHSYGGAVALHIARHHPERVASLCLYEPTAFDLLLRGGPAERSLGREIAALAGSIGVALEDDKAAFAAQVFTEFWGGQGAWQALDEARKAAMLRWIPKVPLDFAALLNEPAGPPLLPGLPLTLICGERTRPQARAIVARLADEHPLARVHTLAGANHMGPFVRRDKVFDLVLHHLGA